MLYRADTIAAARQFGDEFLDQGGFADFLVADDQEDFGLVAFAPLAWPFESNSSCEQGIQSVRPPSSTSRLKFIPSPHSAHWTRSAIAGHLLSRNFDRYRFYGEKRVFGHDPIGLFLGVPWIGRVWDILRYEISRVVFCGDMDRLLGFGVDESHRHLAVVEKF